MIIHSLLPNPKGKDANGEWFKIFNDGNAEINLSGWQIKNSSGKSYALGNINLKENGFLTLTSKELGFMLKNTGDHLSLYNKSGNLVDEFVYAGQQVKEGSVLERTLTELKLFENFQQNFGAINTSNFPLKIGWVSICIVLSLIATYIVYSYKKKWSDSLQ